MSIADTLGRLTLFADLTASQLEAVAHTHDEEIFAEGQRVLRQGLSGSGFFVILEGEAAIEVDGEERLALGPGDFFGEISVLTGEPPTADVVATTLLRCLVVSGPTSSSSCSSARGSCSACSAGGAPAAGRARMAAVERPFPPGDYDVVVVGSGPGGLQTSY